MLVLSDGTVKSLWIADIPIDSTEKVGDIDKVLEEEMIILKLKDIYDTDETEYRGHSQLSTPSIIVYENELCIRYTVSCDIYYEKYDSVYGEACSILIPVRLISDVDSSTLIE